MNRAVAVSGEGTYLIIGEAPGRWVVKFTRSVPKGVSNHDESNSLNREGRTFFTAADAMHACHLTTYPNIEAAENACQKRYEQELRWMYAKPRQQRL